ncbi:TonB-dependent receptor [Novosphingobium sp. PS1R-30]|uniref:TonB-dependent receptor n=1 Tax=Novosphingobium anseongense TaxID=3133436 RepID=A0ABU8S1H1_9SPHN
MATIYYHTDSRLRRSLLGAGAALSVLLVPVAALAQDAAPPPGDADQTGEPAFHREKSTEIVVTGGLRNARQDMLSGVAVVQAEALTQALRPSIGETLAHTPGASATSFGPTASRPVLRGLQGERVRLLTDGLGAIDVSNTSADHAAVVNPLLAERIEVLRGPQSLLYGSSAIGGVVNVIDRRIPVTVPDEAIHVGALATYGSAANERSVAGAVDVPVAGRWVIHVDGSYTKTDDLKIGDYALSPALRAEALASGFADNAAVRGKLPNSASETWAAGAGAAYIDEGGSIGISYGHYDSLYGIPVRYATQPGQEQEAPRISLRQDRVDARAEINAGGDVIDKIALRLGYADYSHFELEEDGAIGTAFYNKGLEGRLELTQAKRGAWRGVTGAQFFARDFDVVGDEAFLPKNKTQQLGLFTLQQLDYGALKVEAGARFEHSTVSAAPGVDQPQFFTGERRFDAFSGSFGASYALAPGWRFGVNASRTERAPSAEELFANGPHAGTEAFEIGDPGFKSERAWSVEAILRGSGDNYTFEASAYHSWFSNFIYQDLTGAIEDGLPVYQFRQADARYYGFEAQGSFVLARIGDAKLGVDALADYVHATIEGSGPAPRIPPLRVLGGVSYKARIFDLRGEVEHVTAQNRISPFETRTPGFTLVNAELNVRPWGLDHPLTLALSANNIFNVDARRHASVLKDYAPLAGRDIRVTARVNF